MGPVIVASCIFAAAGALMSATDGARRPLPTAAVVALFGVGAIVMARAVQRQGLANAWLVGLGLEAVVSTLLGMWLYSERFSTPQMAGLVLVVGGTALLRLA